MRRLLLVLVLVGCTDGPTEVETCRLVVTHEPPAFAVVADSTIVPDTLYADTVCS